MENRKNLFKPQSRVLSPLNHNKINRERQRVARGKSRKELFQSNRIMDISPTPSKRQMGLERNSSSPTATNSEQENPQLATNGTSTNKMSERQANYLKKFLKWKEDKHQATQKKEPKGKPLLPQPTTLTGVEAPQKRRSIYLVDSKVGKSDSKITTMAPKSSQLACTSKQLSSATASTALQPKAWAIGKLAQPLPTAATSDSIKSKPVKPFSASTNTRQAVNPKPLATADKPMKSNPSSQVLTRMKAATAATSDAIKSKSLKSLNSATTNTRQTVNPKQLTNADKPIKSNPSSQVSTRMKTATAATSDAIKSKPVKPFSASTNTRQAAKPKQLANADKPIKSNPSSQLSTRMKAKKPAPPKMKQKQTMQVAVKKMGMLQATADASLYVVRSNNLFKAQATSTACKSNSFSTKLLEPDEHISDIIPDTIDMPDSTVLGARRQLIAPSLPATETQSSAVQDGKTTPVTTPQRYPNRQSNGFSPFVTVSRGKENSRAEHKSRQSVGNEHPETPVAVRHQLDSVEFFRMQLDTEIRRLHSLCDEWNLYINQNEARLQETGGKDLINAAIGQTKLLTSKKLMQFKSLIDRCEAGAKGVDLKPNDGTEETKPVFVEDLEGWWDMLRLQSENVDKRFDHLLRLKANDWLDPDAAVLPKTKSKVGMKPMKKPAAKASRDLKSFLRKAFADKQKKQISEALPETSSQSNLTSTRRSQQHHVIVVRDRKSFSPARTVLRVANGSANRPSIGRNMLLRSAIMGAAEEISRQPKTPSKGSPISILKTPGTKKREPGARIIFSAKKKVRQFVVEEDILSEDETAGRYDKLVDDREEDMTPEKSSSQDLSSEYM